ncbi:hypothetical protein VTO73DRAFT_8597 [Trametes versicolor]
MSGPRSASPTPLLLLPILRSVNVCCHSSDYRAADGGAPDTHWPVAAAARRGEIDNNYGLQSRYRVVADYPHMHPWATGGSVGGTSW